jgi:hypothetical protein
VGTVHLGHRRLQPFGGRRNKGHLEGAGGHHDLSCLQRVVGGADLEPVVGSGKAGHPGAEPDRQVEGGHIRLEVVGHRIFGRVGVGRSRERHAGQAVVLGWSEQLERVPAVTPGVAQFRSSLQHHKPQALAFEVPGDRQTGLAGANHDRIEKSIR